MFLRGSALARGRGAGATHLAVAVAGQLRDEAHVVLPDLDHLLADVVLGAAAGRRARPAAGEAEARVTGTGAGTRTRGRGRTRSRHKGRRTRCPQEPCTAARRKAP